MCIYIYIYIIHTCKVPGLCLPASSSRKTHLHAVMKSMG